MNKLQFSGAMLLAAASVWTSCQSEDEPTPNVPVQGNAISFRIQGSQPSTYVLPTKVENIDGFVVNGWVDDAGSLSKVLFNQKSVVRDATSPGNSFIYSPIVYFPVAASEADFVAYSPISANVGTSSGKFVISETYAAGDNEISYTSPSPGENGGTVQEDLLVANTHLASLTNAAVGLQFKHALSRVLVTVTNTTPEPLIIKGLSLVNIYTEGTLKLDADTWDATSGTAISNSKPDINDDYFTASAITLTAQYKVLWNTTKQPGDTMKWLLPTSGVAVEADSKAHSIISAEQAMLVIPQTTFLTNGDTASTVTRDDTKDFYLKIDYALSNITATAKVYFNDVNGNHNNNDGLTFEFGKQYNLSLVFTPGSGSGGSGGPGENGPAGISFVVTVDNWEDPANPGGLVQ